MQKFNVGDRVRLTDRCTYQTCIQKVGETTGIVESFDPGDDDDSGYPFCVNWSGRGYALKSYEIELVSPVYLGGE